MICVVYLARVGNPQQLLESFIHSYQSHTAGIDHEFLVVFKGFKSDSTELALSKQLLKNIEYTEFDISDDGLDITAYQKVLSNSSFSHFERFCFFNSHSNICSNDWLLKLNLALDQKNVGLVGATGSFYSFFSDHINRLPKLPILEFDTSQALLGSILKTATWSLAWLKQFFCYVLVYSIQFDRFPNPHLRTNGMMAKREVLAKVNFGDIKNKSDAYRFESGKNSLSKQILRMGLQVKVVGKNGQLFDINDWTVSHTFWQGNQSNLLISDNQTRNYDTLSIEEKKTLEQYAWGKDTNART